MSTRDGHATPVTKIGYESVLSYNVGLINDVGQFVCSGPASGTLSLTSHFNQSPYSLPSSGENLVIRANVPIQSTADLVISVVGTDEASGAATGTATIKGGSPRGQAHDVVLAGGHRFATVTAISLTGGVAGDGFDISVLPATANDTEVLYVEQVTPNLGTTTKPVYNNYDLKHTKRLRPENKLSIQAFYTNNVAGLSLINDRDTVLNESIFDNGGNTVTEQRIYDKAHLIITKEKSANGEDFMRGKAEGFFQREFIFS